MPTGASTRNAPTGVQASGSIDRSLLLDCATTRGDIPSPATCTWPWLPSNVPHIQRLPSGLAANRPDPPRSPSSSTDPSWLIALSYVPDRTKIREPAAPRSSAPALTESVCTTLPSGRSNRRVADPRPAGPWSDTTISTGFVGDADTVELGFEEALGADAGPLLLH